jgi:hypothetical protein
MTVVVVELGLRVGSVAEADPGEEPAEGDPPDEDTDDDTDGEGAGAAPDGPEPPPPSATTPNTSNPTPSNATSTPINRAPPGSASVDRSRLTGGGPPPGDVDPAVDVDAAGCSPPGWSPEPPVRSSNV